MDCREAHICRYLPVHEIYRRSCFYDMLDLLAHVELRIANLIYVLAGITWLLCKFTVCRSSRSIPAAPSCLLVAEASSCADHIQLDTSSEFMCVINQELKRLMLTITLLCEEVGIFKFHICDTIWC